MRYEYSGRVGRTKDFAYLAAYPRAQAGVQIAERLVEQDQGRVWSQGPGQGDALLLAPAELVGHTLFHALQPGKVHDLSYARSAGLFRQAAQAELDVGQNVDMGEQGVLLKDHAHTAKLWRHVDPPAGHNLSVDLDHAGIQALKAGDEAQGRRLATSRRTQ